MTELPQGWALATVADFGARESGAITDGPYGSNLKTAHYTDSGPTVIRLGNITPERLDITDRARISEDHFASLPRHHVQPGDVVVAALGDPIGRACRVPPGIGDAMVKADCFRIRTSEDVDPDFLVKWLNSPEARGGFLAASHGLGRIRVNLSDVRNSPVPLPPLPEQRRIVAKLDRLSARSAAARDHLAHTTKLVTRAKQAILDAETVQATEDCHTVTIAQIVDVMFDGPFGSNLKSKDYTSEGVRVVRLENIGVMEFRSEKVTFISEEKFESLQRHSLQPEDLVFSSFVADDVRAALIPDDLGPAINKADCFCVRPDRDVADPKYLLFRLSTRQTYRDMEKLVHGATRPRIGLKHLKAYEIALPSLERQRQIVHRIEAAFARIDRLTEETSRAAHLLDRLDERLLAKAFAGELVPQDPKDEPAEALLSRIREARATTPKPRRTRGKKTAAE